MQPLSFCSDLCTSDVEKFEHQLTAVFGAVGFELVDRECFNLRSNFVQLHDLDLGFWTFGTAVTIDFAEINHYALGLPLKGHGVTTNGGQSAFANVKRPIMVSAGRPTVFQYGADLAKLFVRIQPQALERTLAVLLGAPINRRLEFELTDFTSPEMLSALLGLIDMLVRQFDDPNFLLSDLAVRELEKALIVQLLLTSRHQFSAQLQQKPPQTSLDLIKRAEGFIEANWNQPITMEELTEVTKVSARSLFRSFKRLRGYSPMAFARKVRLERALALLSRPDPATSVTGVALACGFSNLGRFAHDYRFMFGELPSDTLNQAKGMAFPAVRTVVVD